MKRVLVIDDEPDIRTLVQMTLRQEGYEVAAASDGAQGLHLLAELKPDVILLDLRMPVVNGWRFLEMAHESSALEGVRVVAISAHTGRPAAEDAKAAGCDAYISKPFTTEELLTAIRGEDQQETTE
jgi:CheY-like chemotaxis protein